MPQSQILPDGRLHLQHGPIDLIIQAWGKDRTLAFKQATARFQSILNELVADLPLLRKPVCDHMPTSPVARKMIAAAAPFNTIFITPMAAVAGAVADEICRAMSVGLNLDKAYVNNGGDIAVHLSEGASLTAALHASPNAARITMSATCPARGLATSGWQGRSHSLGIADAVTVLAKTAAQADVAATLIANAVNLPDHPAIFRTAANLLSPDSDLGARLVTTDVGGLTDSEINTALKAGQTLARNMIVQGQITAAALLLRGKTLYAGGMLATLTGDQNARLQTA